MFTGILRGGAVTRGDTTFIYYTIYESDIAKHKSGITIEIPKNVVAPFPSIRIAALIKFYEQHQYSSHIITTNIAQFYWMNRFRISSYGPNSAVALPSLIKDKIWIDTHYTSFQYGDKYYQCVLNKLRLLEFRKMQPIIINN